MISNEVVIIPARGGSKRIPNKNLRLLNGKPLIAHSIIAGKKLGLPVYVSSDSEYILKVAEIYGALPVLRPAEFATDTSTDLEWAKHFLASYYAKEGQCPEKIVFLRPTTPLRDPIVLKRAIETFKPESTSLRSVQALPEAPEKAFRCRDEYLEPITFCMDCGENLLLKYHHEYSNLPNQVFPTAYMGNGYIDIIRPEVILNTKSLYGNRIQGFITEPTVDIDNLNSLKYCEYILGSK